MIEENTMNLGTEVPKDYKKELSVKSGSVWVTLFTHENTDKEGTKFTTTSVAISRSYKDKDDTWQNTKSIRAKDLLDLSIACKKAYEQKRTAVFKE